MTDIKSYLTEQFSAIEAAVLNNQPVDRVCELLRQAYPKERQLGEDELEEMRSAVQRVYDCRHLLTESECVTPTLTLTDPKKRSPRLNNGVPFRLSYRLIEDPDLRFVDRIVFSVAWKWARCNRRRPRVVSTNTYFKTLGFRRQIIDASLRKLKRLGYLNDLHQPLVEAVAGKNPGKQTFRLTNGRRYLGHRRLEWMTGGGTKQMVFSCILFSNKRGYQSRPAWMAAATGVSPRTAFRLLRQAKAAQDG